MCKMCDLVHAAQYILFYDAHHTDENEGSFITFSIAVVMVVVCPLVYPLMWHFECWFHTSTHLIVIQL